ncbi:MAG: RIP metalloprotease RseP [Rhodospirillales bacterium]|nr:RIP metalloprotease RseP [Rhodospirillales bacterium]|tara:strand:- start:2231 stop:3355 length:1125 start_codon:yes stop_codon:yes gene_type:complete
MEFLWYILPFILIFTVLVFVHELGHYLAARQCNVRVEVFSVGFGKEIFGLTDKFGTRWRLSSIPLGGYVKLFGVLPPDEARGEEVSPIGDEDTSFYNKPTGQKAWIYFAGPLANLIFAVAVLAAVYSITGKQYLPASIGKVYSNSAAERAGIRKGDIVIKVGKSSIKRFEQLSSVVRSSPGKDISLTIQRNNKIIVLVVTPKPIEVDVAGSKKTIGRLGVSRSRSGSKIIEYNPLTATWEAIIETLSLSGLILDYLGQVVSGERSAKELGGPIRIAQISGDVAQTGIFSSGLFQLAAFLSINLGIINLLPIPLLDGGQLLVLGIEALRRKPLEKGLLAVYQNIGLVFIVCLTIFVFWNDLVQLRFVDYLYGWIK